MKAFNNQIIPQNENQDEETRAAADVEEVSADTGEEVPKIAENPVDFTLVCQSLLNEVYNDKDLLNFAWYLHKNGYVTSFINEKFPDWTGVQMKINFCNCAKLRSGADTMNNSRLEQMYLHDTFPADKYTILWEENASLKENVLNRCRGCNAGDESLAACPYFLSYCIARAAEKMGVTADSIYEKLLGNDLIAFRGRVDAPVNAAIDLKDYEGIDSKSAHAAFLLILSRLIHIKSRNGDVLEYTHLPICRGDDRKSLVGRMTDFWRTGVGKFESVVLHDKISVLQVKSEGCRKCGFVQCPHKLAAYICGLADKYGVDAQDLAWFITTNSTYAKISVADNFQFNRYLTAVNQAPMKEESKVQFIKMIHFIVGRQKNRQIPFLPFNMAITSPDRTNAEKIVDVFQNALWHFDYYRQGKDATTTRAVFLSSTSFSELLELYQNSVAGTTMVLYDTHLMSAAEDQYDSPGRQFKNGYHKLLKVMEDRKTAIQSVIVGTKDEVDAFFGAYPEFRKKIFTKHLQMFDLDKDTVFDKLYDKLTETFEISEDVATRLARYINVSYPSSNLRSMEFVDDLYEKLLFNHYNHDVLANNELAVEDIPYLRPPRSEEAIFSELNKLVGLANVKKELQNVNDLVKFNLKMGANNKNSVNMHMVFAGNPGTGKTTVARLTAELLHSIGFIQENKLICCSAKDMIGEYMGQTTPRTAKCCEAAYNGVLFIDEAYQLNPYTSHHADTYKEECIAELIQQMENNRDRLVVIFAGYTDEMEDFLNKANTGLRSRIGQVIEFPDYNVDELIEIFRRIVNGNGMSLGEGADEKLRDIISGAMVDAKRFGNARYARNLYEHSLMRHAAITANLDEDDPALRIMQASEICGIDNS